MEKGSFREMFNPRGLRLSGSLSGSLIQSPVKYSMILSAWKKKKKKGFQRVRTQMGFKENN